MTAQGLGSATANITTGGGNAQIAFTAAPDSLTLSTDGGMATLTVPGGPYALTADTNGGPESVRIPTDPAAPPSDHGQHRQRPAPDRTGPRRADHLIFRPNGPWCSHRSG